MQAGAPFVRVDALGKRYGDAWALRNVSFDVLHGEIFGVIGPNGAGKTTTLKVLAGLVAPTEGGASLDGTPVADTRLRKRIGYLPEESPLYDDMTARSYLRFFADLYQVPRRVADERIAQILHGLDLDADSAKRIGDMSKGMRRKVAIARALVHEPDLLLFDEPASGLDPVVSAYVIDLVQELRKRGKTVVFSAHNLFHVERICDRVLILREGAVVANGSMKEIRAANRGTQYVVRVSAPIPGSRPVPEGYELTIDDFTELRSVEAVVQAEGGRVVDVREKELTLEEIFLRQAAR